jgi:hypothetical protein
MRAWDIWLKASYDPSFSAVKTPPGTCCKLNFVTVTSLNKLFEELSTITLAEFDAKSRFHVRVA